jgi:hypothetical protein
MSSKSPLSPIFVRSDGSMTPAQCRARGQRCRDIAGGVRDEAGETFLAIAEDWDHLAQQYEELERLRSAFLLDWLGGHSAPN